MNDIQLQEILKKRDEIMNKKDEYITVGSDSKQTLEKNRTDMIKYNFNKDIRELTTSIKLYLKKQNSFPVVKYLSGLVVVSGLIVLNDYILITYIL